MTSNTDLVTAKAGWFVYMVRCADDSLYTGVATDVSRRVAEHNGAGSAGARYTRGRRPVRLVYHEPADSRAGAGRREWQIKRLSRDAKERLIHSRSVPPSCGGDGAWA